MRKYGLKSGENKLNSVSSSDIVFIGLDVHKNSVHSGIRINGQTSTMVMPAEIDKIISTLKPLRPACCKIVYEAGPTGFGLARALQKSKWPVEVIAPGKIPRPANEGSKADRLDCCQLAEYGEKDILKKVAIPTEQEEADRQVTRLRCQLVRKERRVKQQIKSLLLLNGIKAPQGLQHWTQASIGALREFNLSRELRFTLDALLDELEYLHGRRRHVEQEIRRLAKEERYKTNYAHLRTHPGVGQTVAMKFLTEIFQPDRFDGSTQIASFVGLAPKVRQSGEKRIGGPLQKAGQGDLRAMLVQAAWQWIRRDPKAAATYRRLVSNTGRPQVAIVGMARKMAVNLWCMLVRGQDYNPSAG